jgi:hypothetical protein
VTIIEQLERADGVAVQGPPGTGKTHTIANIVCHFLATGRKVLVTSKGEQALEVLKSKIPAEVQPLTVALLAGDREGMRQFQSSIEAIIHNVSHLNPEVVREQIAAAHSGIERAHEELAQIDRRVARSGAGAVVRCRGRRGAHAGRRRWPSSLSAKRASMRGSTTRSGSPLSTRHLFLPSSSAHCGRRVAGWVPILSMCSHACRASASSLAAADVGQLHRALSSMRALDDEESSGKLLSLRAATRGGARARTRVADPG